MSSAWDNFKLGLAGVHDLLDDGLAKIGIGHDTTYAAQELADQRKQAEGLSDVQAGAVAQQLGTIETTDGIVQRAAGQAIDDSLSHPIDTLAAGAAAAGGGLAAAAKPLLPTLGLVSLALLLLGAGVLVFAVRR